MILDCDVGNSRCKWRLSNGAGATGGSFDYREAGFAPLNELEGVEIVRAVLVADSTVLEQFCQTIKTAFELEPSLASSTRHCSGVTNIYKEEARLGVDRWSAMVAAYNQQQSAVLVVDAGSAITVDLVAADGCHKGGYIVPGRRLMASALLNETGGVRFQQLESDLAFGRSTDEAVGHGLYAAQLGLIALAVEQAKSLLGDDLTVVLTGGDSELLMNQMLDQAVFCPDLVLDGLNWLLPNNK